MIKEDDEGEPHVKIYAREDGPFSGEALAVFSKEDSMALALNLTDDAEFRFGDDSTRTGVQRAELGHKQQQGPGGWGGERKVVDGGEVTKKIGKMQKCVSLMTVDLIKRLRKSEDEFGPTPAITGMFSNQGNKGGRVF